MAKKMKIGGYAFLGFLAVILLISIVPEIIGAWGAALTVVLALVVALLNITEKETMKTLMAALVLAFGGTAIFASLGIIPAIGAFMVLLLTNLATYMLATGVFVAIKVMAARGQV
jgi:hypothetical protein